MKRTHKLLSLILTICIALSVLSDFSAATAATETVTVSNEAFELPDIVDQTEAVEKGYVGRVESEENDLYTFVFANGDGTNTMRVYSHPVKYVADDGSVRDISLDVEVKDGGGYITADHEIITTFESKLTEGISLAYNDVEIMLVPKLGMGAEPTAVLSNDSKVVTYKLNDITSFVYELTYAGFKEDIVVAKYTGQTEYEFTLYTNGLTLYEEYGSYYLADAEGNIEATIGDIIVFTADERNNTMGRMTCETVHANQEYVLTIHLDAEYLADADTVYPIRIDPTIEINYDNNGTGAIEDVTIAENITFGGTSGALYVGRNSAEALVRSLMRFPHLSLNGIAADQISSATVEIRDLMCQGDQDITVECRIYNNSAPSWTESGTTTWSSVGTAYFGSLLDSHLISYGQGNVSSHRYSFNILSAARAWANGTQSPSKGLVFKANSTFENQTGTGVKTWYKTFASYNRSNYRPSLSIVYSTISGTEYYIAFQSDGKMLTNSSSFTLSRTTYSGTNTYQKWIFTEVSSGVYIIRMKNDINKCLTAVPSNSTITISNVSSGNSNQYWKMDVSQSGIGLLSKSTDSRIANKKLYYNEGSFTLSSNTYSVVAFINASWFVPCTSMSLSPIYINVGTTYSVQPTCYPANSNMTSGWVLNLSSTSTNIFTVDDGKITARNAGVAKLTVTNKITGVSCSAYVYVSRLPNPDAQNKDLWCWAASAKKVGEHNGGAGALTTGAALLIDTNKVHSYHEYPFYGQTYSFDITVDAGQRQIVMAIYNNDDNNGGTPDNIEFALQMASKNTMNIGTKSGMTLSTNISFLNNELAQGRWVVGDLYPTKDTEKLGHAIVITSYDESSKSYQYWDPWTNDTYSFPEAQLLGGNIMFGYDQSIIYKMVCFQYCN